MTNDPIEPEPTPASLKAAGDSVKAPAICLIVVAVLSLMNLAYAAGFYFFLMKGQIEEARAQIEASPQKEQMQWMRDFIDGYEKVANICLPIQMPLILIASFLMLFGAVKMLKLKNIGWSRTAAILAMIPGLSGCCLLGLVFGIWALVLLSKAEVKAAFAGQSKPAVGEP